MPSALKTLHYRKDRILARNQHFSVRSGYLDDQFYQIRCDKDVLCTDLGERGENGFTLRGDTLMNVGILINEDSHDMKGDFRGLLIDLTDEDLLV